MFGIVNTDDDPQQSVECLAGHYIQVRKHPGGQVVSVLDYERWSGGAKVSCILCHRGVQLILAYSWARPAILVAGKG